MTLLYILLGLLVVYLAYSFGSRKGMNQSVQGMSDQQDMHQGGHSHNADHHSRRGGGCC